MIDNKLKSFQKKQVLNWLRAHRSLTRREAHEELDIANVTARITELRQDGYNIETRIIHGENSYGYPTHWAEWTLHEEPEQMSFDSITDPIFDSVSEVRYESIS